MSYCINKILQHKKIIGRVTFALLFLLGIICIIKMSLNTEDIQIAETDEQQVKESSSEIIKYSMPIIAAGIEYQQYYLLPLDINNTLDNVNNESVVEKDDVEPIIDDNDEQIVQESEEVQEETTRENKLYCVIDEGGWKSTLDIELQDFLWETCKEYDITEYYELLMAQMYHESNFVINIKSNTNDYGLMQINKCNHDWLSEKLGFTDFMDPYNSIVAGVYLMSYLLNKYDSEEKALVCYNMGERTVKNGTYSTKYSRGVLHDKTLLVEISEES